MLADRLETERPVDAGADPPEPAVRTTYVEGTSPRLRLAAAEGEWRLLMTIFATGSEVEMRPQGPF